MTKNYTMLVAIKVASGASLKLGCGAICPCSPFDNLLTLLYCFSLLHCMLDFIEWQQIYKNHSTTSTKPLEREQSFSTPMIEIEHFVEPLLPLTDTLLGSYISCFQIEVPLILSCPQHIESFVQTTKKILPAYR